MSLPTVAWILVPSVAAPGKFNVRMAGNVPPGNMSTDPNGVISFKPGADGNYEQYTRNGLAVEIAPGSDQNPAAPTIVILPPGA